MFDDDDPVLARVRVLALGLPEAKEKVSHGRPAFYTGKVFAYYGGSTRVDGRWVSHDRSLMVLPDEEDRRALDLDREDVDWDEVAELLDASYRTVANKRQLAALDGPGPARER